VDYQTKIIVDATKALKDLGSLSKVLKANDKHINNLSKSSVELNKALKTSATNTGKLNTQTKYLNTSIKKNTVNTGKLVTQTKYLNDSMKKSVRATKLLTTQTKHLNTSMKANTSEMKKLSSSTAKLNASLQKSTKAMNSLVNVAKGLNTATKANTASVTKLNTTLAVNNSALKKNSENLRKMSTTMTALGTAVNKSVVGMRSLATQTNALSKNVVKNSASLGKLRTTMTALGTATNKAAAALNTFNRNSAMLNASLNANTAALNKLSNQMLSLGISLDRNTASMVRFGRASRVTAASQKSLGISVGFVNKFLKIQLVLFRTAMLAATAYAGIKLYIEFNKTAESIDLMGKKLNTFTGNTESLDIIKTSAFKTGFAIQDLGRIITRFAITTEGAFSTSTLAKWTEGLVMSARAAGTSTMEMNNALIQLSQSFSAGFLMGDEYRSISENLPLFKMALRDVADEAGMAGESLKALSSGRKIDIELMTKALQKLSEESMKYTFALDNIEAAEQRVKIGWDLWANSVADSRALKDSLNFIAGLLSNLANDGAAMNAFTEGFPEMSQDVENLTSFLMDLYDTTGLVYDRWEEFFNFMSLPGDETFRMKAIAESIEFVYDALNDLPINIKTVTTIMLSSFMSFKNSVVILFETLYDDLRLGFMDTFGTIDKYITRIRAGFNKVTGDTEEYNQLKAELKGIETVLADVDKQYKNLWKSAGERLDAEKALDASVQSQALADRDAAKKEFDRARQQNKDFRDAVKQDAKNQAQITPEKDKGYTKRNVVDKKAITAYKNAVKKATREMEKFFDVQRAMNNEINALKNPFSTKYDASGEIKALEEQLERLNSAREVNIISQDQYNKAVEEQITLHHELVGLKQEDQLNELARGYDEVKAAAFEYAKVKSELTDLANANKISEDAYTKALYESERALLKAKAASGDMNESDQFLKGMNDGLYDFANNNKTVFEEMSELTTKSFSSMTDELTEFVTTGKADFKGLVDSIVKDLTRIAIQKSITEPLADAMFGGGSSSGGGILGSVMGMFGGGGGASAAGGFMSSSLSGSSSAVSAASMFALANGGVMNQGNLQAFANGGVVSSPTIFPMADGAGLMGEAGAEAIMPLKRGKDGKLGVASAGSEQNITININVSGANGNPEAMRRSAGQVAQAAGNATSRAMKRNG